MNVNERSGSQGQVSFPDQQFLRQLSENKPYVRTNETRAIVLSLDIPNNARIGTNKTITVESQPYVNTNNGMHKIVLHNILLSRLFLNFRFI